MINVVRITLIRLMVLPANEKNCPLRYVFTTVLLKVTKTMHRTRTQGTAMNRFCAYNVTCFLNCKKLILYILRNNNLCLQNYCESSYLNYLVTLNTKVNNKLTL